MMTPISLFRLGLYEISHASRLVLSTAPQSTQPGDSHGFSILTMDIVSICHDFRHAAVEVCDASATL